MNFPDLLACVGLLTIAGACGVLLGWLEKKAWEEKRSRSGNKKKEE